jgi:hypothetical protein
MLELKNLSSFRSGEIIMQDPFNKRDFLPSSPDSPITSSALCGPILYTSTPTTLSITNLNTSTLISTVDLSTPVFKIIPIPSSDTVFLLSGTTLSDVGGKVISKGVVDVTLDKVIGSGRVAVARRRDVGIWDGSMTREVACEGVVCMNLVGDVLCVAGTHVYLTV